MMNKRYLIFCEPCAYKQFVDSEEAPDLLEVKRVDVPGGTPYRDPETKSVKEKKKTAQPRVFKCPKCGRGVVAKRLPEVYVKTQKEIDKRIHEEEERKKIAKLKEEEQES